jgi:hypothetical protein
MAKGVSIWHTCATSDPMCATFESTGTQHRPGRLIPIWRGTRFERVLWGGFARSERLGWWKSKGCLPVDVPAGRFAERSQKDGRLHWGEVPEGHVIRGLWDSSGSTPQILIVTRPATLAEVEAFGHDRMPLLEAPLYSCVPIGPEPASENGSNPGPKQMELF